MNWKELQLKNSLMQAGNSVNPVEPEKTPDWLVGWDSTAENAQEDYDNRFIKNAIGNTSQAERYAEINQAPYLSIMRPEYNELANELGYGTVKGDTDIPFEQWAKNPIDYRAASQSPAQKILNGAGKMLALVGTTYLDNTAGLVAGIMNIGADLTDDNPVLEKIYDPFNVYENREGFHPVAAFRDNPLSKYVNHLREAHEEYMPNYRTVEEMTEQDQWWKHMNANFWGDTVLKNLGFTIGAGLSGATFAKGFTSGRGRVADKAYKAALAASEGDAEAANAFRQVMQGGRAQSASRMYSVFDDVQNSFRKLNIGSQIVGGIGGALGESRMEAMMAAKEFRDERNRANMSWYEDQHNKLIESIANNPNYIDPVTGEVNQNGLDYYSNALAELQLQYTNRQTEINNQAENVANSTFGMNAFVLSLSNMVMFGKLFSGGYKSQAKNLVRGTFGNYKPKGSVFKGVTKGILNAGTEGMEELTQKIISEGNKRIGMDNMASFHNKQFDKDATREVTNSLFDMLDTVGNVLVDPTSWEEFAVGFFTGALGAPTHVGFSNWSGGLLGGIQDGLNERNKSRELTEEMNKRIKDPQFRDLYMGLIRHKTLENLQEEDIASGNKFAWHTHKDEQLMSDVMMFADAGRLDDLESFVSSLANVDDKQIAELRPLIEDPNDPNIGTKSNDQIRAWLGERANAVKTAINQYRNFYNTIDYLSFGTTDKNAIKELVFSEAQLDNFERRYNDVLDDVLNRVKPELQEISRETKQDGSKTEKALRAEKLLASEDKLRRLFGGVALDIKARGQDSDNPNNFFRMVDEDKQQEVLNDLAELGIFARDRVTKQDVSDLQALVLARSEFYAKLFDPKGRKTFKDGFQEEAISQEEAAQNLEADARRKTVEDAISKLSAARNFGDFLKIYNELPDFDDATKNMFAYSAMSNPATKDKWDKLDSMMSFFNSLRDALSEKAENVSPTEVGALQALSDAMNNLDLISLFENESDDADEFRVIGNALLDMLSTNPDANQYARGILEEILGDRAQAYGFGMMPGSGTGTVEGQGGGEGTGGGEGGGQGGGYGGSSTKDETRKTIERNIQAETDKNATLLNKIANGDFSDYPADMFSDQEKAELVSMAMEKLAELNHRVGLEGGPDEVKPVLVEDDRDAVALARSHAQFVAMDTSSLNISPMIYDPDFLKKGIKKLIQPDSAGRDATNKWFINHNCQEFIDTGALAKLSREYEKRHNGEKLPIYFLANPHLVENNQVNQENNPFVVKNSKYGVAPNILMAVEMNDENREILQRYFEHRVITDSTLVTVQEGNNSTQYQVIGEMWSPSEDDIAKKGADYQGVRDNAQLVWENAINKNILPHYRHDVEVAKRSGKSIPDEGRWYVARNTPASFMQESDTMSADFSQGERMFTNLNYIMSGRNEVKKIGQTEYTKKPLANSLKAYTDYGGKYYFRLSVNGIDNQKLAQTAGAPAWADSIYAPPGSLWIATTEANGAWSWSYVTIARANPEEFDFEANKNTALVRRIDEAIDAALNKDESYNKDIFSKRLEGIKMLRDIFYFGDGNNIVLDFSNGPALVVAGQYCKEKEDVYRALQNGNYRFQVSVAALNDTARMNELIQAGVLRSEMESFVRMGATVGVEFMTDKDADGNETTLHPVKSGKNVARTSGSSIVFGSSENGVISNVRIGEAGYAIDGSGKVFRMASKLRRGTEVEDDVLVAEVKAVAELLTLEGQNAPYPGRKWIISDKYQYTELYERVIGDKVVHMKREGKNGAFELVFSDQLWKDIMDADIAKLVGPQFTRPEEAPKADNGPSDVEMYKAFGADAAQREGGQQVDIPDRRSRGGRRGIGRGISNRRVDVNAGSQTLQDAAKQQVKDASTNSCR